MKTRKTSRFDVRFFESTRGRTVKLLRGSASTVNELAAALGLTDNAVRAHLLSLERDGLVRQSGTQRGSRKPHFAYELTPEAERLFPKAYDVLLNRLIAVLKSQLAPDALADILRDVGRSLADTQAADHPGEDFESRLARALNVLEAIGGAAAVVREGEGVSIRSRACPLAAAVAEHPEVCRLAEALVAEIVGAPVEERCDRDASPPRCRFEIALTA
jgi:predicted ArsR family transcriptional regulator